MKTAPEQKPAPAEWIADLKESIADLEAGRVVELDDVLAEGEAAIARIEARHKNAPKYDVA
jgi:predicted transcriptional regulator